MKSIAAWLAVTGFFVVINVIFAGLIYGLFMLGKRHVPGLMEEPFFVYPLGLLAVAGGIWCGYIVMRATRPAAPRSRVQRLLVAAKRVVARRRSAGQQVNGSAKVPSTPT